MGKLLYVWGIIIGFGVFLYLPQTLAQGPALNEEQQIRSKFIEACTEYMREEYDKAEALFLEILEEDKQNAPSLYYVGKIHTLRNQKNEALTYFQKAAQLDRETLLYQEVLRDLYVEMGSMRQAIDLQRQLAARYPDDLGLQMEELSLYTQAQEWERAKEKFEAIQSSFDPNPVLNRAGIQIYTELGENDRVAAMVEKWVEDDPSNATYVQMLSDFYTQQGQAEKSLSMLKEVLQSDPENAAAQWLLSVHFWEQGDTSQFESLILPAFSNPSTGLAQKVELLKAQSEGETPPFPSSYMKEVVQAIGEAHQGEPGSLQLSGDMYYMAESYDSAFSVYKRVIAVDPSNNEVWQSLLASAEKGQQFEQLLWQAEEAMSYFPNNAEILSYYGLASVRMKKWDQAQYAFSKIEKLPDVSPALKAKYLREWARMEFGKEQLESALQRIQQSQSLQPNAQGYELHGDILFKLGREKEAEEQWNLAIENGASTLNIQEKLTQ